MSRLAELRAMRDFIDREIEAEEHAREERRCLAERDPLIDAIISRASELYGVTPAAVLTGGLGSNTSKARHAAAWLLRQRGLSFSQVGRLLGIDHTSVLYACRKIDASPTSKALLRGLAVAS